jgi:DMSO reductase anchor subunit
MPAACGAVAGAVCGAADPVAAAGVVLRAPRPHPWFAAAALCALVGPFFERWLFFAEAKHLVTLYY